MGPGIGAGRYLNVCAVQQLGAAVSVVCGGPYLRPSSRNCVGLWRVGDLCAGRYLTRCRSAEESDQGVLCQAGGATERTEQELKSTR
jgi:hypothetical protein